jgi:hypothetical protein
MVYQDTTMILVQDSTTLAEVWVDLYRPMEPAGEGYNVGHVVAWDEELGVLDAEHRLEPGST